MTTETKRLDPRSLCLGIVAPSITTPASGPEARVMIVKKATAAALLIGLPMFRVSVGLTARWI